MTIRLGYGVRLSFALSYWLELGALYPAAAEAFRQARNDAEIRCRANPTDFHCFHDVAALNRSLNEVDRTVNRFESIAASDRASAERLYHVAEPFLISTGRFQLCGQFMEPFSCIERAAEIYRHESKWLDLRRNSIADVYDFPRRSFVSTAATQVALLVLNGREDDAQAVYNECLEVVDDEEFRAMLDAAMSGHLPSV